MTSAPEPRGGHPDRRTLRRYLDDALEPSDAETVGAHLEDCQACSDVLDQLEPPVRLPEGVVAGGWDERRARRAARRTVLRTAIDAVLVVTGVLLIGLLLSQLVWQPLVVGRGDRVADAVAAAVELVPLTVPGGEVEQWTSNPGLVRRHVEVEATRRVGPQDDPLGTHTTAIGPLAVRAVPPAGGPADSAGVGVPFEPDRLGEGTAVTVLVRFDDPRPVVEVDELAVGVEDAALEWVGFATVEQGGVPVPVGYGACHEPLELPGRLGLGGYGSSAHQRPVQPEAGGGASHALEQARRAVAAVADASFDTGGVPADSLLDRVDEIAQALAADDPGVATVVATGSTDAVAELVDAAGADSAELLAVDFDIAPTEPCG